jgi:glycosyltransferase involved in cell wall biosynthesis
MVLCHGNRAIGLALRGLSGEIPVIGVAHNYHIKKRFPRCDAVFCITRDLVEEMIHLDMRRDRLFYIPNMVRIAFVPRRTELRSPPVIGTMGRFVAKKGFDIYLHALKALKGLDVPFKAVLGGDGEEKATLQKMATEFGLDDVLTFTGWVQDKEAFYKDIDIFVLPSLHEPFGIVLIEAMGAGLPCVTTDTEGPCEIIRHQHDALLVEKAKPYHMAAALRELIENTDAACEMGYLAHLKVRDRYDIHVVEQQIERALTYLASEFLKPISES